MYMYSLYEEYTHNYEYYFYCHATTTFGSYSMQF